MSEQSPNLSLPFIQAAQAQKHVTHNEAVELLDVIVQMALEALDAQTPPSNAVEGQAWAIGTGATDVWAGRDGEIAAWHGGGWLFVTPNVGWLAWDKTTAALYAQTPTGWEAQSGGTPDFQNLTGVGINAASDSTNKLAVAADATLLTHNGAGHQLKLNKANASDTASLLFQSNWNGHAEMGLAGDTDFSIKVSPDGANFTQAAKFDVNTGVMQTVGISGTSVNVGPDAVGSFAPPYMSGIVAVTVTNPVALGYPPVNHGGIFIFDVATSPSTYVIGKGNKIIEMGSTALTGTSGTLGNSAIACAVGEILIENRTPTLLTYTFTCLGGS